MAQSWQTLGLLYSCLFACSAYGKSMEASAQFGSSGPLTPFGSRTAARRGVQGERSLLANWNMGVVEDSSMSGLLQREAGTGLEKVRTEDVGNVLLDVPRYHTNGELQEYLHGFVRRCGHLADLVQFGNSTLGTPLWALEISDHPGEVEPEPAFKFVGNMHGDEPTGRELILYMAEWLCENYKRDKQATRIVDRLHLFLVPSLNPDGFDRRERTNPNGVDLNRDFPDQFFANNNEVATRQAETRALMDWTLSHHFTAGASLHEGAVVANYPWDGSDDQGTHYSKAPDDVAFRHLASAYAQGHAHMWNSSEFQGGITNGAEWYPLYGGMQDWNYLHAGCLDITIEVNDNKWPPAERLPSLWADHQGGMLAVLDVLAKSGLHGLVTSSMDEKPLHALVEVEGAGQPVWTRPLLGDFHRVLAPGTYVVHVAAPGFANVTVNATVVADSPTELNFELTLEPAGTPSRRGAGGMYANEKDGEGMLSASKWLRGRVKNVTQFLLGGDNATWGAAGGEAPAAASLVRVRQRAGAVRGGGVTGDAEKGKRPRVREAGPVVQTEVESGRGGRSEGQSGIDTLVRGAQGQRGITLEDMRGRGGEGEEDDEDEEEAGQLGRGGKDTLRTAAKGAFDAKDDRKRTGDFGREVGGREVVDGAKRAAERKRVEWGVGGRENTGGQDMLDDRLQTATDNAIESDSGRQETAGTEESEEEKGRVGKRGGSAGDHGWGKTHGSLAVDVETGSQLTSPGVEQRTIDSYYAEGQSTWNHLTLAMAVVFTFMLLILWSWLRGRRTRSFTARGRPARVTRVPQIGGPGLFRD